MKITKLDKFCKKEQIRLFKDTLENPNTLTGVVKVKENLLPNTYIKIEDNRLQVKRGNKVVYEIQNPNKERLLLNAIKEKPILTAIILNTNLGMDL